MPYIMISTFFTEILRYYAILWITHIPLPMHGYGYECEPQIWQQFVDLVFQDDLIKHEQNFDVIMDDTFIHFVRHNLAVHHSVTPFIIRQPIQRPGLLERVYKPMRTLH